MLKLGLTGNICAGKSEVEKLFQKRGYEVIDLDIVSHKFLEESTEIYEHFKTRERSVISKIVFSDTKEKIYLESVLHPMLYDFVLGEFNKNYDKILISGALLYEAGFDKLFDKIIFVDAPYETRLLRLIKRNNFSNKEAELRLNSQNDNYKNCADYIIENDDSIEKLEKSIDLILSNLEHI